MKCALLIGGVSWFARELLRWLCDILGFGLGVACFVIFVVGLLPGDRMREQRSVAVWGPRCDVEPARTADVTQTASAKSRISDSIGQHDRDRE